MIEENKHAYTMDTIKELHKSRNHLHGVNPNVHANRPSHPSHFKIIVYNIIPRLLFVQHAHQPKYHELWLAFPPLQMALEWLELIRIGCCRT